MSLTTLNSNVVDLFCEYVSRLKILVVGDLILDEYIYCSPVGTTTKAPVISAIKRSSEIMLGGAAAVARHCANFSPNVTLLTRANISDISFIKGMLNETDSERKIDAIIKQSTITPKKSRYISSGYPNTLNSKCNSDNRYRLGQKLFEIAQLPNSDMVQRDENYCDIDLAPYDLIIVMDFGHGFMTDKYWDQIRSSGKFVALNVQTNSTNYGFNLVTKYNGADLLCLDELEIRLACSDRHSDIEKILQDFRLKPNTKYTCLTRGSDGMILVDQFGGHHHFPALAEQVVDPVGAGDAVLSLLSMCIATGFPLNLAGIVASAAGGLACQIVGNSDAITKSSLRNFLKKCEVDNG